MKSISKFLDQIKSPSDNTIFRGQSRNKPILPSIGRMYKGPWQRVENIERQSLHEFKNRWIPYFKNYTPSSDLEWMALMQHHGCPTRLLDFTTNPLIAIFFATAPSSSSEDGIFIAAKYSRRVSAMNDDDLFEQESSFAYYPPHLTERIIGQSGCFLCSPKPNKPLEAGEDISITTIPGNMKERYRWDLKRLGITHSTIFPGLDGIGSDIRDQLDIKFRLQTLSDWTDDEPAN